MVSARAIAESVVDPELPMLTLHDLGVLRDVREDGSTVIVELAPTYSGCPAVAEMRADVSRRLQEAGYHDVDVRLVLTPPWTTDDITDHGREVLAQHGIAPPGRVQVTLGAPVACPQCGSRDTERLSQFGATPCKALYRCRSCREPFEYVKPH